MSQQPDAPESPRLVRSLRLTRTDLERVVTELDKLEPVIPDPDRRGGERVFLGRWGVLDVASDVAHMPPTRYEVQVRNVSLLGASVLHGMYVPTGLRCRVIVLTPDREPVLIPAKVGRCRHVWGRVHELGLHFTEPCDLSGLAAGLGVAVPEAA